MQPRALCYNRVFIVHFVQDFFFGKLFFDFLLFVGVGVGEGELSPHAGHGGPSRLEVHTQQLGVLLQQADTSHLLQVLSEPLPHPATHITDFLSLQTQSKVENSFSYPVTIILIIGGITLVGIFFIVIFYFLHIIVFAGNLSIKYNDVSRHLRKMRNESDLKVKKNLRNFPNNKFPC